MRTDSCEACGAVSAFRCSKCAPRPLRRPPPPPPPPRRPLRVAVDVPSVLLTRPLAPRPRGPTAGKRAKYCSRACQRSHWSSHRQTCADAPPPPPPVPTPPSAAPVTRRVVGIRDLIAEFRGDATTTTTTTATTTTTTTTTAATTTTATATTPAARPPPPRDGGTGTGDGDAAEQQSTPQTRRLRELLRASENLFSRLPEPLSHILPTRGARDEDAEALIPPLPPPQQPHPPPPPPPPPPPAASSPPPASREERAAMFAAAHERRLRAPQTSAPSPSPS
eukprot:31114-Pelagococcus_subviridis.AAC.1